MNSPALTTEQPAKPKSAPSPPPNFWGMPQAAILDALQTSPAGLTSQEASARLSRFGANLLAQKGRTGALGLLISQFKSPIILILLFAAGLSLFLGEAADAVIILAIVLASGLLGFWQERGAADAVQKLLAIVQIKATVLRDGTARRCPRPSRSCRGTSCSCTPATSSPATACSWNAKDLFVDEAALTGETFPVEKAAGSVPPDAPLGRRTNCLFMGTHVVSGTATALVVHTGRDTEFGRISGSLRLRPPGDRVRARHPPLRLPADGSDAAAGPGHLRHQRLPPPARSWIRSSSPLALAVGLTPQLLPAIISINLAHGAKRMAEEKVIVKRLASIENFGSMDVLCSDKTGTLTEGEVQLHGRVDVERQAERARCCSRLPQRLLPERASPTRSTQAIVAYRPLDAGRLPQARRRALRLRPQAAQRAGRRGRRRPVCMVTKGALANVLEVCTTGRDGAGRRSWTSTRRGRRFERASQSSAARASARWASPTATWAPRRRDRQRRTKRA